MITKSARKKYIPLLTDLAVMARKKEIVEHLSEYGIASSYEKLKRFRYSVACDPSERINQNILKLHNQDLVQTVKDNSLKEMHSLAMMMLLTGDEKCEEQHKINCLATVELKDKDLPDISFVQYKGFKKPAMTKKEALRSVLPLSIIAKAVIFSIINSEFGFEFLKRVLMIPRKPEYSGFNTEKA